MHTNLHLASMAQSLHKRQMMVDSYRLLTLATALGRFSLKTLSAFLSEKTNAELLGLLESHGRFIKPHGKGFVLCRENEKELSQTLETLGKSLRDQLGEPKIARNMRQMSEPTGLLGARAALEEEIPAATTEKERTSTLRAAMLYLDAAASQIARLSAENSDAFVVQKYRSELQRLQAMYDKATSVRKEPILHRTGTMFKRLSAGDPPILETSPGVRVVSEAMRGDGYRSAMLFGSAGIGKTTFCHAIASDFEDATILHFECSYVRHFNDVARLLHFDQLPYPGFPELEIEQLPFARDRLLRLADIEKVLFVIFDGIDALLDDRGSLRCVSRLFNDCRSANNLKILMTTSVAIPRATMEEFFSPLPQVFWLQASISERQAKHASPNAVCVLATTTSSLHPLATRLTQHFPKALDPRSPRNQWLAQGTANVNSHSPLNLLDREERQLLDACKVSWNAITHKEREMLAIMWHLPGGVWYDEDVSINGGEYIGWAEFVFPSKKSWKHDLSSLHARGWLSRTESPWPASSRSYQYNLRPSLRKFVSSKRVHHTFEQIESKLINFWANRLETWVARIPEDSILGVDMIHSDEEQRQLMTEEAARFCLDINFQNWRHSFEQIARCFNSSEESLALHFAFIRAAFRYCSVFAKHNEFQEMARVAASHLDSLRIGSTSTPLEDLQYSVKKAFYLRLMGAAHRRLTEWESSHALLDVALRELRHGIRRLKSPEFRELRGDLFFELAALYSELGQAFHVQGTLEKAEHFLHGACRLGRIFTADCRRASENKGVRSAPADSQRLTRYASTLVAYADLLNDRHKYVNSYKIHEQALEIRMHLASDRPVAHRRSLAGIYKGLGNCLYAQSSFAEAKMFYERAIIIELQLVKDHNSPGSQYLARLNNNMGNALTRIGELEGAESFFNKAVESYEVNAQRISGRFKDLLARTLTNLARLHHYRGNNDHALRVLKKAALHHSEASVYVKVPFKWIDTHLLIATIHLECGSISLAEQALSEARMMLDMTGRYCDNNRRYYQAQCLSILGKLFSSAGQKHDLETALTTFEEALRLYGNLRADTGTEHAFDGEMACIWHELGKVYSYLNRWLHASECFRKALSVRERLFPRTSTYMQRLIAQTKEGLAEALKSVNSSK